MINLNENSIIKTIFFNKITHLSMYLNYSSKIHGMEDERKPQKKFKNNNNNFFYFKKKKKGLLGSP